MLRVLVDGTSIGGEMLRQGLVYLGVQGMWSPLWPIY